MAPKKYTRKNRNQKRQRKTLHRRRRGGEGEPAPSSAYILVECWPDSKAREIFKPKPDESEAKLKGKYIFKLINITRIDDASQIPVKESGIFRKQLALGNISNIKFKGQLVPSTHLIIKTEKLNYNPKPVDIEFKFSKNLKQLNLETSASGTIENIKFSLSSSMFSSKKPLRYIPRNADMFNGNIKLNFLNAFPNKPVEQGNAQKAD